MLSLAVVYALCLLTAIYYIVKTQKQKQIYKHIDSTYLYLGFRRCD